MSNPIPTSGGFKKGFDPRRGNGRTKGTPNRTTKQIREFWQAIVDENNERIREDLDRMSPAKRWDILEKLAKYFMPTLSKTAIDANVDGEMKIEVVFEDTKKDKPMNDDKD